MMIHEDITSHGRPINIIYKVVGDIITLCKNMLCVFFLRVPTAEITIKDIMNLGRAVNLVPVSHNGIGFVLREFGKLLKHIEE